jgi:hypothetical protein
MIRPLPPVLLLLALGSGCKVVDAPETLEELVVFGFVHFDDHAAFPSTVAKDLRPLLDTYDEELLEGYRVQSLTATELAEVGVDGDDEDIVGMAATVELASALDDVAWAWSYPHMDEVLPVTVDFELRSEDGDRDCFLDHECETYAYEAWRQNDMGFFGTSEQTFRREFRWAALDEGDQALTVRDLVPDPAEISVSFLKVDQQYSYSVLYQAGSGTLRMDTFWIDAVVIGIEVPDYFALDMAVNSMNDSAEAVDAFVEAERGR